MSIWRHLVRQKHWLDNTKNDLRSQNTEFYFHWKSILQISVPKLIYIYKIAFDEHLTDGHNINFFFSHKGNCTVAWASC